MSDINEKVLFWKDYKTNIKMQYEQMLYIRNPDVFQDELMNDLSKMNDRLNRYREVLYKEALRQEKTHLLAYLS